MKLTLAGLLIIAFVAMATFGAMAMGHGQIHDRIICIASAMQASGCPKEVTSAASFGFHLEAFNAFFTAVFNNNLIGLVSALLALVAVLGLILFFKQSSDLAAAVFEQNRQHLAENFVYPFNRPIIHWLALRERSPAKF